MEPMELTKLIKARAHRILRHVDRYRDLSELGTDALHIQLQEGEEAIGLYKNQKNDFDETIVITSYGLHVLNRGWSFIEYRDITNVTIPLNPAKDKRSAGRLVVYLKTGNEIEIPVSGGDERTRDAWSFLRFLQRIIRDVQKRSE